MDHFPEKRIRKHVSSKRESRVVIVDHNEMIFQTDEMIDDHQENNSTKQPMGKCPVIYLRRMYKDRVRPLQQNNATMAPQITTYGFSVPR